MMTQGVMLVLARKRFLLSNPRAALSGIKPPVHKGEAGYKLVQWLLRAAHAGFANKGSTRGLWVRRERLYN